MGGASLPAGVAPECVVRRFRHNWAARQRGGAADALKHLTNYTGWQRVACEQLRSLRAKLAAHAMTKVRQDKPSARAELRPEAGEAAPDASKPSRQPSFRPTKLPVILPTPHRTEAALRTGEGAGKEL